MITWSLGTLFAGQSRTVILTLEVRTGSSAPPNGIALANNAKVDYTGAGFVRALAADHVEVRVCTAGGLACDAPLPGVLNDNMEYGVNGWFSQPPWGQTTATSHSPTHSWTDSPGGNYGNNRNINLRSPVLDFSGVSSASLSFWHRYDFQKGSDFGRVWVTTDNGTTFTLMASFTGTKTSWSQTIIDLSAFAGQPSVQIVFQLLSDGSGTGDGWYIDDVLVPQATIDTAGLYNPATSTFYLRNVHAGGAADATFRYGLAGAGWWPIAGDWGDDDKDTVGLYNPATSTFYLRNVHAGGAADITFRYGSAGAGWEPVVGDWNGM